MEGTPADAAELALAAMAAFAAGVDALTSLDLAQVPEGALLPLLIAVGTHLRRVPAFDHSLLTELGQRNIAGQLGHANLTSMLVELLRISASEAKAREKAARDLGPHHSFSGEPMEPVYPVVAAAQAAGEVSVKHARVVVRTVEKIPAALADQKPAVERVLTDAAREFGPRQVAQLGDRALALLDPDGVAPRDADHQHRCTLTITTATDGMARLSGWLTPAAAAVVSTVLDSLSQPVPATLDDDEFILAFDPRRAGQRRHDALQDACERLLRDGDLPRSGGVPVSLVITMSAEQFATGHGYATTGHSNLISIPEALNLADQTIITTVVLDAAGGVMNYGTTKRCLTEPQRRALAVRDRGCSFLDCSVKPNWCEAHHVICWADGGETSVSSSTLLCGWHHRTFEQMGWECQMLDGVPHWVPPAYLDPDRKPRRNLANHPIELPELTP